MVLQNKPLAAELRLVGLEFRGHHGVTAEERETGGRYRVDLSLSLSPLATKTDDINDTVDYVEVGRLITETSEKNRCKTVERLARLMLEAVHNGCPQAEFIAITVAKLSPPTDLHIAEFSVTVRYPTWPNLQALD